MLILSISLGEIILHHLADATLWHLEWNGFDISITKRVVMMWIAAFIMIAVFVPISIRLAMKPYNRPSRLLGFFEIIIEFIRSDLSQRVLGRSGRRYEPFLLTLFFFVLFCNLLGLIPPLGEIAHFLTSDTHADVDHASAVPFLVKLWPGITATGDISVTAGLAGIVLCVILLSGFIYQGIAYIKNIVPTGVPILLAPLLWVIELSGLCIKPVALSIRLLANMVAGHIIILILMSFIFQFKSYYVAGVSVFASVAIYLLEIFVAFLQAYIFTFLSSLFISEAQHRH